LEVPYWSKPVSKKPGSLKSRFKRANGRRGESAGFFLVSQGYRNYGTDDELSDCSPNRGRIRTIFVRGGAIFSNLMKRSQDGWLGRLKDIRIKHGKGSDVSEGREIATT
jgi:hypothetical protein